MDIRTLIIHGAVLLLGLGLLMSGVGWAVRQQVLLTRDEIRDTLAADLHRLLTSLGRCLDPTATRSTLDPPTFRFPVRSCAIIHAVEAGPDPEAALTLRFATHAEAAVLVPAYILARRAGGALVLERNGCRLEILEKPAVATTARPLAGLCPPRTNGNSRATIETPRGPVTVTLQARPRRGLDIAFRAGDAPPFYRLRLRDIAAFDVTYVVGTKRFLRGDGGDPILRYDLDANDDRVLTLDDQPVLRPFLKQAASGVVLHFPVAAPYAERYGTRCGRYPIRAGERRQCLEIEFKPG